MNRNSVIEQLINNKEICPVCGKKHTVSLKAIRIGNEALKELPEVISELGEYSSVVMVCDQNTYSAAGKRLEDIYPFRQIICIPAENLHATETAVFEVNSKISDCDLLVAVGSGTIHDITRYIAAQNNIDFISVPTAASVDGFVSGVAAMTWHGAKRTFPAIPPIALIADSDVISNAPYRLTASGVGDLVGKYTALFDWRVSHILTDEYICEEIIKTEFLAIQEVIDNIDKIKEKDPIAIEALTYGLILSGIAMQMVGNSRPASGSEHHISHLLEMKVLCQELNAYHGEQVGIGSAIICDKYHRILSKSLTKENLSGYSSLPEKRIREVFKNIADEIIKNENTPDPLIDIDTDTLIEKWSEIQVLAENTLPSAYSIKKLLQRCGAFTELSDIGVYDNISDNLYEYAPFVRRRMTFMRISKLVSFR